MSADIKALLKLAPFSFIGTIVHLGAATTSAVTVDGRTAVVHVDHVLHAPDAFARMEGQLITVQLLATLDLPALGETHAFFTEGRSFGDSLAVTEVGRRALDAVLPQAQSAAAAGLTAGAFDGLVNEMRQDELRAHAKLAAAVVLGRVLGVAKVGQPALSEHDPDWWCATIEVDHVETGTVSAGPIKVLYANSRDVRWHKSPKPQAGQSGVWLLHKSAPALDALAPYQLIDSLDMQPAGQLQVLRQ